MAKLRELTGEQINQLGDDDSIGLSINTEDADPEFLIELASGKYVAYFMDQASEGDDEPLIVVFLTHDDLERHNIDL